MCMFLFIIGVVVVAVVLIAGILTIVKIVQLVNEAKKDDQVITREELIKNFNQDWMIMTAFFAVLIVIALIYLCMHLSCICDVIKKNRSIDKMKKAELAEGTERTPLVKKKGKLIVGKDKGVIDMDHSREDFY